MNVHQTISLDRLAPENWQVGDLVKALDNRREKGIVADEIYMVQTTAVHGKSIEIGGEWHPVGAFILYRPRDWTPEDEGETPSRAHAGKRFEFVKRGNLTGDTAGIHTLVVPPMSWRTSTGKEFSCAWVRADGGLFVFHKDDKIKLVD